MTLQAETLMPLKEGEIFHHFTDSHVVGIPKDVHQQFSGFDEERHRTLVLQWLKSCDKKKYMKVLCVLAEE